jgi:hypothetical protein
MVRKKPTTPRLKDPLLLEVRPHYIFHVFSHKELRIKVVGFRHVGASHPLANFRAHARQ